MSTINPADELTDEQIRFNLLRLQEHVDNRIPDKWQLRVETIIPPRKIAYEFIHVGHGKYTPDEVRELYAVMCEILPGATWTGDDE